MEEEKSYSKTWATKSIGDASSLWIINTMTVSIPKMNKNFVVLWSRMTEEFSNFIAEGGLEISFQKLSDIMDGTL